MKEVYEIKCGKCGMVNKLLNNYIYYFREFQKTNQNAVLVCTCGNPLELGDIGKKKYKEGGDSRE